MPFPDNSLQQDTLLPDFARSPLVKTNYNSPIFVGQVYRKVYSEPKSIATIHRIDNLEDNRHADTISKYQYSIPLNAIIHYTLLELHTPTRKRKPETHILGTIARTTYATFRETFPYLCFCPRTFPHMVTTPSKIQLEQVSDLFDPKSDRVKNIERARWRHNNN